MASSTRRLHAEDIIDFDAFGVEAARLEHPGGVIPGAEAAAGPELVDCAARFRTCRSCCCSLYWIPLTRVEAESGRYTLDEETPADEAVRLKRDENGTCVHHDRAHGRCGIWAERPLVCRLYWCIDAEGVWSDFSRQALTPEAAEVATALARSAD